METDRQNQHMDTADSELSAAKMVLRLADELRQKESEIAALRMKTMEELQSHRKAKNAELDAVSRVQEERISKRERELAGTWVRREAELWNKYQSMLESITEKHRAELEAERARFQAEMNRRDREIPEQRDRLRAEMESAYVRWEKEREDRLRNERETFVRELELGREAAKAESEARILQTEEVWKQRLSQRERELVAKNNAEVQAIRRRAREEAFAELGSIEEKYILRAKEADEELEKLRDKMQSDFNAREADLHVQFKAWREEVNIHSEAEISRQREKIKQECAQQAILSGENISRLEREMADREQEWKQKHDELQSHYLEKEEALSKSRKKLGEEILRKEEELARKHREQEGEIRLVYQRQQEELKRRDAEAKKELEAKKAEVEAQAARLETEREEFRKKQNGMSELFRQREQELTKAYDDRLKVFQESMEETFKVRERTIVARQEQLEKQCEALLRQKESGLERISELQEENTVLRNRMEEESRLFADRLAGEQLKVRDHKEKLENDSRREKEKLETEYVEKEKNMAAAFEGKIGSETQRLELQLRIREDALAERDRTLQRQADAEQKKLVENFRLRQAELEARYNGYSGHMNLEMTALKELHAKELVELSAGFEKEKHDVLEKFSDEKAELKAGMDKNSAAERENLRLEFERKSACLAADYEKRVENVREAEKNRMLAQVSELETANGVLSEKCAGFESALAATRKEEAGLREQAQVLKIRAQQLESEKQRILEDWERRSGELREVSAAEYEKRFEESVKEHALQMSRQLEDFQAREQEAERRNSRQAEFLRTELEDRYRKQLGEIEKINSDKLNSALNAMEENCSLREKSLEAGYMQMEKKFQSAILNRAMAVDQDRKLAEDVGRLKSEFEQKNAELSEKLENHAKMAAEQKEKLEKEFERKKDELEESVRAKSARMENERIKLSAWMLQEEKLLADLQKREAALKENFARKEAELQEKFEARTASLEKEYQEKVRNAENQK